MTKYCQANEVQKAAYETLCKEWVSAQESGEWEVFDELFSANNELAERYVNESLAKFRKLQTCEIFYKFEKELVEKEIFGEKKAETFFFCKKVSKRLAKSDFASADWESYKLLSQRIQFSLENYSECEEGSKSRTFKSFKSELYRIVKFLYETFPSLEGKAEVSAEEARAVLALCFGRKQVAGDIYSPVTKKASAIRALVENFVRAKECAQKVLIGVNASDDERKKWLRSNSKAIKTLLEKLSEEEPSESEEVPEKKDA